MCKLLPHFLLRHPPPQAELERLNGREREIFEALVGMGVNGELHGCCMGAWLLHGRE
jgi:hypothetical protein